MKSEFLSDAEVGQITEYSLPGYQCKELSRMGVKYFATRSGKPLVSREAVRQLLGCKSTQGRSNRPTEPNLED